MFSLALLQYINGQTCSVFVKELDVLSEHIFDKKALSGKSIDFHDVMYKFTLDSFVV